MKLKSQIKNITIFLLTIFSTFISPAFAYGGPGAAIGAIIVLITIILAFFSSLIIKIFKILKVLFSKLNVHFKSKKKKKDKNN